MTLKAVRIQGKVTTGDITKKNKLTYELGRVEAITSGKWELALSTISLFFHEDYNANFEISTNYIDTTIPTSTGKLTKPMPIGFVRAKGAAGEKTVIGYKCRDFFEITTPSKTLVLYWQEIETAPVPPQPPQEKNMSVSILLLLRRIQ